MSQIPDPEQPGAEGPSTAFLSSGLPPLVDGSETVVNPERRGMAQAAAAAPTDSGSSIWSRLFPSDSQLQVGGEPIDPAGVRMGHFRIEGRIGTGGMGAVFRATDERLQRPVALKILSPAQSRDSATAQRFENEARAAARLSHDNIAGVYYIGEDQGLHFIAYEFVTGTNIRDLIIQNGRLDPAEAVNYTLQIARALLHTSAAGVVHRDIKPSNIIITPRGLAKLVDLGLARKQSSDSAGELTLAGTTLGTFDYISPEQAKDPRNVDVRSDIYSLGCTLYHMLTGAAPYPEGTVLQKLLDHQGKNPPDPAKRNARVSPELSAIVKRMMASDPRRRYSTPEELIRDLMPVAAALGLRGVHPEGIIWTSSRLQRRRFWESNVGWVATVAVLLLIVVVLDRFPDIGQQAVPQTDQPVSAAAQEPSDSVEQTAGAGTERRRNPPLPLPPHPLPAEAPSSQNSDGQIAARPTARNEPPAGRSSEPAADGADDASPPTAEEGNATRSSTADAPQEVLGSTDKDLLPVTPDAFSTDKPSAGMIEPVAAPPPPRAVDQAAGSEAPGPDSVALRSGTESRDLNSVPLPVGFDEPSSVSIVGTDADYLTLEAACSAAQDGQIIELRYNGRRAGPPEKPLRIKNKRITIRAGKDRAGKPYRPAIEFDASRSTAESERRMITLMGGSLQLINVDVRINAGDDSYSDDWALFTVQGSERVDLKGVNITFVNPQGAAAAVFELSSGPAQDLADMNELNPLAGPAVVGEREFRIKVVNSFVCGDCDLFLVKHSRPGRFVLENSVFAIEGTLLGALGDLDMPEEAADLELQLDHVTGLIGNSLVRMDSGQESRLLLPVQVTSQNSIFATNSSSPLIAMTGTTDMNEFRTRLRWTGTNNFYDGFETFWSIAPTIPTADLEELDFEDWQNRWGADMEVDATLDGIAWERPWHNAGRFWELAVADFALDEGVRPSPEAWEATDTGDVGADLSQLSAGAASVEQ